MKEERFWQEGMDGKRFALCLFRRKWIPALAGVLGGLAAAAVYLLVTVVFAGAPQYQVLSQYRIYFDSEKYGEIQDYYNAYTWGEIMKTDQVVDFVMEALPEGISKEQVKESVSVGAMSDIKIMPLYVTTTDAQLSETIAGAYVYGLDKFARSIEGLSGMECWLVESPVKVARGTKVGNAAFSGMVLGLLLAFGLLVIVYCLDDSIYLEEDFSARFSCPVLGTLTRERDPAWRRELESNLSFLLKGRKKIWLASEEFPAEMGEVRSILKEILGGEGVAGEAGWPLSQEQAEAMRRDGGAVVVIRWGARNGRRTAHFLAQLEKQQIPVPGVVIYGAEDDFLRRYYGKNAGKDNRENDNRENDNRENDGGGV